MKLKAENGIETKLQLEAENGKCIHVVATYVYLRKEYARSRHQRLFDENVRKNRKRRSLRTLTERLGSCIYARGRY